MESRSATACSVQNPDGNSSTISTYTLALRLSWAQLLEPLPVLRPMTSARQNVSIGHAERLKSSSVTAGAQSLLPPPLHRPAFRVSPRPPGRRRPRPPNHDLVGVRAGKILRAVLPRCRPISAQCSSSCPDSSLPFARSASWHVPRPANMAPPIGPIWRDLRCGWLGGAN